MKNPICVNCGAEVLWAMPRPEDLCLDCDQPIGTKEERMSTNATAGHEQYMVVEEDTLNDEDGPHEVDVKIIPEYGEIEKHDRVKLQALAHRLSDNFDGRYIVISSTRYSELRNR